MRVHYLDDGGIPIPEATEFEAMLSGVHNQHQGDEMVLEAMMPVLEALYTRFRQETA